MKKSIAVLVFVFCAASAAAPFTSFASEKKAAKSAAHKHKDMKEGCGDMKSADCSKKGECCKMDSKKESSKTEKEESKKESEKK